MEKYPTRSLHQYIPLLFSRVRPVASSSRRLTYQWIWKIVEKKVKKIRNDVSSRRFQHRRRSETRSESHPRVSANYFNLFSLLAMPQRRFRFASVFAMGEHSQEKNIERDYEVAGEKWDRIELYYRTLDVTGRISTRTRALYVYIPLCVYWRRSWFFLKARKSLGDILLTLSISLFVRKIEKGFVRVSNAPGVERRGKGFWSINIYRRETCAWNRLGRSFALVKFKLGFFERPLLLLEV